MYAILERCGGYTKVIKIDKVIPVIKMPHLKPLKPFDPVHDLEENILTFELMKNSDDNTFFTYMER